MIVIRHWAQLSWRRASYLTNWLYQLFVYVRVCYSSLQSIIISMYLGGAMKQNRETESVFFFDKAQCASCFRATRLFVSKTRHEASNQEGQGKPLRSLTSHRRVNDLRGEPRPSWLRALCQVFDTKKSSFPKRMTSMLLSQEEKNWRGLRFCWIRHRYMEIIFWNLRVLRRVQFIFSPCRSNQPFCRSNWFNLNDSNDTQSLPTNS